MDRLDARRDQVLAAVGRAVRVAQGHWVYQWMALVWTMYGQPWWTWLFATITGTATEGGTESAWAKDKLTTNDVYRDRLLAKEIAMFVDLGDALGMSGTQRHALFVKFLHLDWMRRSAISIQDLCLYCTLRRSRFADCILPVPNDGGGFRQFRHRFELVQLTTALFNVCTLPPSKLVEWTLAQAKTDPVVQALVPDCDKSPSLRLEIAQVLLFVYGTLTPNEAHVKSALETLYLSFNDSVAASHGMMTLEAIVERFPVLIFPVFWLQRTLRRRVLGTKFWAALQVRRTSWGSGQIFYTPRELMDEAKAYRTATDERDYVHAKHDDDDETRHVMTVRTKVLPVDDDSGVMDEEDATGPLGFAATIQRYSNEATAWQVTADNLLAAIHIKQVQMDGNMGAEAVGVEYTRITKALRNGTLTPKEAESIRKSIVKQYGYNFASFIVGHSHLRHNQHDAAAGQTKHKVKKQADAPENWQKLFDPSTKRAFFYNALTGESDWQLPPH
ncbi:hypothetical protein H257_02944 [Aphanomyces astaci]|uniref:WW domain-containing protein n=1 Tax=Aphanomyces astaci TaxID=112090 RepID=W4GZD6_APHAT|nr:hypothetical protein H257_02944 [Aphanomyces astaci]ETV85075.1 hypothetical protein H257_02944 [Aphanomyces astaci]|eukprot:XP_009825093.1 hypothetical protein H257_02944 [Aphanomyces astaci]